MNWFRKTIFKQQKVYYDLYYYIERQIDRNEPKMIALDKLPLSQKLHLNELKHKKVVLVIYEY